MTQLGCNWNTDAIYSIEDFLITYNIIKIKVLKEKKEQLKYLWIDYLCINQENDDDKKENIKIMNIIYEKSKMVIAFPEYGINGTLISKDGKICNWLKRVWTIQECILNNNLLLYDSIFGLLNKSDVYWILTVGSPWLINIDEWNINHALNMFAYGVKIGLASAIRLASVRESKNYEDKIYGILGLCFDCNIERLH